MTDHFDPPPAGPQRPRLEVARLWAGGAATAVVAALIALVGVLIVRAVLRIAVYAPADAGAFGGLEHGHALPGLRRGRAGRDRAPCTCCSIATPRPLTYSQLDRRSAHRRRHGTAVHLRRKPARRVRAGVINLVVGAAIGSLLSGAAANATRPMHVPQNRFHVDEYGD